MSLQWAAVATFFYAEILAAVLLCSPFISPQKWLKIFRSRLVRQVVNRGKPYFSVLLLILVLLFMDALWEMRKFDSSEKKGLRNNTVALEQYHMKLYRAQWNLHLTSFSLLMSLLLRRLVTLQSQQALLQASREALRRQALGALEAAQRFLDENERLRAEVGSDSAAQLSAAPVSDENQCLREELKKLTEELENSRRNLESAQDEALALRKRCEGVPQEHDHLAEQHHEAGEGLPEDQKNK
ncbi:B-cell receptor-associated protein 31-like [Monodelphis domestica]|uniref:B-cell receptor-associated protein 31-like n=1 Tax=Monodelphis domestica TaxID=13616 RepID=UPI0000D9085D|nr:B-cell receptor-associated protein 31-like [Monodelphis domestica]